MENGLDLIFFENLVEQRGIRRIAEIKRAAGATAQRDPVESRSTTTTSSPASSKAHTMWLPI